MQDTLRPAVAPNRPRRASENSWQPLFDVAVAENGPGRDRRSCGPGVRRACRLCTDSTHLQGRGGPGHRSPSLMRTGEARRRQRGETGGEVEAGRLPPSFPPQSAVCLMRLPILISIFKIFSSDFSCFTPCLLKIRPGLTGSSPRPWGKLCGGRACLGHRKASCPRPCPSRVAVLRRPSLLLCCQPAAPESRDPSVTHAGCTQQVPDALESGLETYLFH